MSSWPHLLSLIFLHKADLIIPGEIWNSVIKIGCLCNLVCFENFAIIGGIITWRICKIVRLILTLISICWNIVSSVSWYVCVHKRIWISECNLRSAQTLVAVFNCDEFWVYFLYLFCIIYCVASLWPPWYMTVLLLWYVIQCFPPKHVVLHEQCNSYIWNIV